MNVSALNVVMVKWLGDKMEYILIQEQSIYGTINKVNEALAKGWTCQGGISTFVHNNYIHYTQAMVREKK